MATSVPVPMAMPRSAWARAGASLMPSPTIATTCPSAWRAATRSALSAGRTSAMTWSMPTSAATVWAVAALSPVTIQTCRPRAFSWATASAASGLTVSATVTRPASGAVDGDVHRGAARCGRAGGVVGQRGRVDAEAGHVGLVADRDRCARRRGR